MRYKKDLIEQIAFIQAENCYRANCICSKILIAEAKYVGLRINGSKTNYL